MKPSLNNLLTSGNSVSLRTTLSFWATGLGSGWSSIWCLITVPPIIWNLWWKYLGTFSALLSAFLSLVVTNHQSAAFSITFLILHLFLQSNLNLTRFSLTKGHPWAFLTLNSGITFLTLNSGICDSLLVYSCFVSHIQLISPPQIIGDSLYATPSCPIWHFWSALITISEGLGWLDSPPPGL